MPSSHLVTLDATVRSGRVGAAELFMGGDDQLLSGFPIDARVGDGNTVGHGCQIAGVFLIARIQIAFQHHPDDVGVAIDALVDHILPNPCLERVILPGVVVGAIHQDGTGQVLCREHGDRLLDADRIVIGTGAAAQHDMGVRVARGLDHAGLTVRIDTEKRLGRAGGDHGVDGRGQVAVGAVFEPDRHGEPAGHLPVGLGFGGACANGSPADQPGGVLGNDAVEHFGGRGNTHLGDLGQEAACAFEAQADIVAAVEPGVVDQALPAHRGARLFKVGAHDQ
ncbi:hypothetical protein DESC_710039 [Desulfosarcina cetonica]|nr:hypothetical protein DESC_710039 [Desulfosarcina cetonica]